MQVDESEEELRRRFHELRRQGEAVAPAFDRLTRAPAHRFEMAWFRVAEALALVVLCAGLSVRLAQKHEPEIDWPAWSRLAHWQAATDSLLTAASTPWGSAIVTPTDRWIESTRGSTAADQTKKERSI